MAENNHPGPTRTVQDPAGFDAPPTDRIPVPGDFSDRRTDTLPPDGQAEDLRDEQREQRTTAPEERSTDPVEPAGDSMESVPDPAPPLTDPIDLSGQSVTGPVHGFAESPSEHSTDTAIFDEGVADRFRNRWRDLQAGFVDDPAQAVRAADELVDEIMRELAERRRNIEERWRGGPEDTEELRVVIREYRSFFNQLLNS